MNAVLPQGLHSYKRTPSFTDTTMPAGLLGEHATKGGVWGLICVEEGELRYIVTDERRERTQTMLTPATEPGVVEPTIVHRVEPVGRVRFYVEFLRPTEAS